MGLKKEKGRPHQSNGKAIARNATDSVDHWAFLEDIEAPMWVDLTLEAQLMDSEIDDAWFRVSHPIHHMSSQKLKNSFHGKDKNALHNLQCHSPKVPNSVSRSRGKHYQSRKWLGYVDRSLTTKHHPVRELASTSLGTVTRKTTGRNSSTSTITTSSSARKPLECLKDDKKSFILDSTVTGCKNSSSSAMSKCQIGRPKFSSIGTSEMACKTSNMARSLNLRGNRNTTCSRKEKLKINNLLQKRNSSASKSSIGSSNSLGSILENIKITMPKNEKNKGHSKTLGTVRKMADTQSKDSNESSKCSNRPSGAKFSFQEAKSKVLSSTKTRKALSQINESKVRKNIPVLKPKVVASSLRNKIGTVCDKENANEGKLPLPSDMKCNTRMTRQKQRKIAGGN